MRVIIYFYNLINKSNKINEIKEKEQIEKILKTQGWCVCVCVVVSSVIDLLLLNKVLSLGCEN